MNKSEGQVLDFGKICRLCLLEKRSMSAIFSKKKSDKKVPLPVRIMSCASLELFDCVLSNLPLIRKNLLTRKILCDAVEQENQQLYEGDGLPASICSKCLLSVNQSYAFREQCEQADTTLRQYAQRMNEASEETSTNRESGERIANDSLERIEDIGNKNEEDGEGKDLEQSDVSDYRICHEGHSNVEFGLNSGKVAILSSGNVQNPEEVVEGIRHGNSDAGVLGRESEVVEDLEESKIERRLEKSESTEENFKKDVEDDIQFEEFEKKPKMETENENAFDSPVLKALSSEKAEDVVVIADVHTINAKFPSDAEEGDGDFGGSVLSSSEDDNPQIKRNWDEKTKTRKDGSFVQLFKSGRRQFCMENPPKKGSFSNQKHLELLQNLMKNKNIVIQKRAASGSTELLTGKNLGGKNQDFKNFRGKKGVTFPYDFKIAQLWKEWEEVNKRIPQVSAKSSEMEKQMDSDGLCSTKKSNSPDVVFETCSDQTKSEEDAKTKWKNGKDTVYCKDCRIFLLRSSYNNHIKFVHEKVRKYLCQTCGYAACTGTILRQHVQAVHVGYSFFCDQCPKKFNLLKRLRKHIELQHSGKPIERNHICQYCGMAFVKPGCLKRHLRSHTQETPYQCQYCQRRFKYRWPKVQHERLHTGEKPYKCSFCEERFTQNCVRKAHEYKKHGNEEFKPKARTRKEDNATTQILKAEKEDSEGSSFHSGSESS